VVFVGTHRVDFVGRLDVASALPTAMPLPLLEAWHSRQGNGTGLLGAADGLTVPIIPGDTVTLAFEATSVASGQARDLFLVLGGSYSSIDPGSPEPVVSGPPVRFALEQNEPNPFSEATAIRFALPVAARARLEIFDLAGRRVRLLADEELPPGHHAVRWDGRDDAGRSVPPGVYVYGIRAAGFRAQRKVVVVP
jgi:hypothetical protein